MIVAHFAVSAVWTITAISSSLESESDSNFVDAITITYADTTAFDGGNVVVIVAVIASRFAITLCSNGTLTPLSLACRCDVGLAVLSIVRTLLAFAFNPKL